jgi:hypothetical protein
MMPIFPRILYVQRILGHVPLVVADELTLIDEEEVTPPKKLRVNPASKFLTVPDKDGDIIFKFLHVPIPDHSSDPDI